MSRLTTDILMITHNRPAYTRLSLARLLDTCEGEEGRTWVWHNGDDEETLAVVRSFSSHPCFFRLHHSRENLKLREPTNWFWDLSCGDLVGKVDDDCVVPEGWIQTLRRAHAEESRFGVIGCAHFRPEDIDDALVESKTRTFARGHRLMVNCWLGGSGYLMKRACIEAAGPIRPGKGFTNTCLAIARRGWINGWYVPWLFQDHMDDPRSMRTMLRTDADVQRWLPLSAQRSGVRTLAAWQAQLIASAREVQAASPDVREYSRWRELRRRVLSRGRGAA